MEVRHFINEILIDEPIGFDSIEFTLERQKHHGFSAESSVGKLEFYGEAYDLIKTAYNSDIDSVLIFKSEFKSGDNWITLYVGNIDLSTYEQQTGDYTSCSCNVAEIGVKTIFNNRTETKIDVDSLRNLDDDTDLTIKNLKETINIPGQRKYIVSKLAINNDSVVVTRNSSTSMAFGVILGFGEELYTLNPTIYPLSSPVNSSNYGDYAFFKNESAGAKTYRFVGKLSFHIKPSVDNQFLNNSFKIRFYKNTNTLIKEITINNPAYPSGSGYDEEFDFEEILQVNDYLFCIVVGTGDTASEAGSEIYLRSGTFLNVTSIYQSESSQSEFYFIDNTFKQICESIAGLECRSELYYRFNSGFIPVPKKYTFPANSILDIDKIQFNPPNHLTTYIGTNYKLTKIMCYGQPDVIVDIAIIDIDDFDTVTFDDEVRVDVGCNCEFTEIIEIETPDVGFGQGALKAITSGLHLRNSELKKLNLSFKELFEAMNAIDCIGWGFVQEGTDLVVRVEKWSWFYTDNQMLVVEFPNNIKREFNAADTYSRLTAGYKKWERQDEANSVDTFHTSREYTTKIKAIDNSKEVLCDFIADPFLIEKQRMLSNTTENGANDNDVFVLALIWRVAQEDYVPDTAIFYNYNTTFDPWPLNVLISPARNAARWANALLTAKRDKFYLSTIEGNANAKFNVYANEEPPLYYQLQDVVVDGNEVAENGDIETMPELIAISDEIATFEYPLSVSDYDKIKQQPYGVVTVNEEDMYLKKLTYSPAQGIGKFTCIPKRKKNE